MKMKRNLLLVGMLALGSIGFATAQEANEIKQEKPKKEFYKKSSTMVEDGILTLSTKDAEGKITTEKVDLSGKSLGEAMSILGEKKGMRHGNFKKGHYKKRGENGKRHAQPMKNKKEFRKTKELQKKE